MRLQPLVRARVASLGPDGVAWVDALPRLLAELEERWSVRLGAPLPGGSASYVARAATADGDERVVKVGLPRAGPGPWEPTVDDEARALTAAAGRGHVLLHAHDGPRRALLLEALGQSLDRTSWPVERQVQVLVAALRAGWRAPDGEVEVPSPGRDKASELRDLVVDLHERLGRPCPVPVRDEALRCAERRAAAHAVAPERCVVVHGDPHPGNLLRVPQPRRGAECGWVLVDPDGLAAEPAYDLGVVLRDWPARLLAAGDGARARAVHDRWVAEASREAGCDPVAVREWAFLERVSTGLYVMAFGAARVGLPYLRSAELLLA